MKPAGTFNHFFNDNSTGYNMANTNLENTKAYLYRVFDRVSTQFVMEPLLTTNALCLNAAKCYLSTEKPVIYFTSHTLTFFVNNVFTIKNIILDGSQRYITEKEKTSTIQCTCTTTGPYNTHSCTSTDPQVKCPK